MAKRLSKNEANELLSHHGFYRGADGHYPDFYAMGSYDVQTIIAAADSRNYVRPPNANGNRASCFYKYLVKRAK